MFCQLDFCHTPPSVGTTYCPHRKELILLGTWISLSVSSRTLTLPVSDHKRHWHRLSGHRQIPKTLVVQILRTSFQKRVITACQRQGSRHIKYIFQFHKSFVLRLEYNIKSQSQRFLLRILVWIVQLRVKSFRSMLESQQVLSGEIYAAFLYSHCLVRETGRVYPKDNDLRRR